MRNSFSESPTVVITGIGLGTSLGTNFVNAMAAAKAGISRAIELSELKLRSVFDGEPEAMVGHPVGQLTHGFEGIARLIRLAHLALLDLIRQTHSASMPEHECCFYLSIPAPNRTETGLQLIQNESTREVFLNRVEELSNSYQDPSDIAKHLLETAARCAGWPRTVRLKFTTSSGHAGVIEALQKAQKDLLEGRVTTAIVGGVDSLLDEHTVWWLKDTGRLKRSSTPAGLHPGEACVFLQLELKSAAVRRGMKPWAEVAWVCTADEESPLLTGASAQGWGLTRLLEQVAISACWGQETQATIIGDQNGETFRATEWGTTRARIAAKYPLLKVDRCSHADLFGDTGAASGGVGISLGVWHLMKNPEITKRTIVSCSDGPSRAALTISSAEA